MTRCTLFGNVEVNELAFHQHDGDSHKYVHLEIKALILIAPDTIPEHYKDDAIHADMGLYYISEMLP